VFEGLRGIFFWEIIDCDPEGDESGIIWEVIDDVGADFSFPALYAFPAGHGKNCLTLPFGLDAGLDGEGEKAEFLEPPTNPNPSLEKPVISTPS
jgi:muramoyltetrapeptide carboxypeptidase LdcA involved in peptidoglycan recycling